MKPFYLQPFIFDERLLIIINNLHSPILDKIMVFIATISEYAGIWILFGLLCFFIDRKNGKKVIVTLFIALAIEVIINNIILRQFVFRERPYLALDHIHHLGLNWKNSSFVSGHTASSIAAYLVFLKFYKKALIPFGILTLLIIWTRFYLGMHYPSDVIGGIVAGIICAYSAFLIQKRIVK
jgi:undecaprenyl-diphosphatase